MVPARVFSLDSLISTSSPAFRRSGLSIRNETSCFNLFTSLKRCVALQNAEDQINRQIHALCCDMLIRTMISITTCTDIWTRQSPETELCTVCTASDRHDQRFQANFLSSCFRILDQMEMRQNLLGHIAVLLCNGQFHSAFTITAI